jgi:multicomponent Na+:H+ antiporter subunit F
MSTHDYLYYIILPALSIAAFMVFIRFFRGPSIADRVISLDLLITIGIGIMCVYAIFTKQSSFLDIAMIFALIAFLGTIAFSYYIEKRNKNE